MKKLEEIRKYSEFIYDHYDIEYKDNHVIISYYFSIPGLKDFKHVIAVPYSNNDINKEYVEELAFNIGMVELVSYYKCVCPKNIIVKCGYLDENQKEFFKKLYFYGLGEFFYVNGIEPEYNNFVNITSEGIKKEYTVSYSAKGNMIAIGGGKDSCVTLELLKNEENNSCFIINPKEVQLECAYAAGYTDENIIRIRRSFDLQLLQLNEQGYLNGHTPFSAMVAFVSYLAAYLNNKEYIVLSNESSANESNVEGTKINHQYSKSYEFENDFNNYTNSYFKTNIHYFSLLRPLTEYQIGMLFSKAEKFHKIFKSCNVGSKEIPWVWCGHCAKCLFVFSLLSPFLYKDKLVEIFNKDLFEDESLLETFIELLGYGDYKPFDCVGTYEEINYAITKTISQIDTELPYLLKYYKEHYKLANLDINIEKSYNVDNNLNEHFEKIIKEVI